MVSLQRAADEYVVVAEDLVKRYDGITAVDGISFQVRRGERFGFLGPNGAGKTTTIRMVYGMPPSPRGAFTYSASTCAAISARSRRASASCRRRRTSTPSSRSSKI